MNTSRAVDEQLAQAADLTDNGQLLEARQLYSDILATNANNAEAWLMLGAIDGELGQLDKALASLVRAIELDPDNAEAHLTMGHVLRAKGDSGPAIQCFRSAVQADGSDPQALFTLASMLLTDGQIPEAAQLFERIVHIEPDMDNAWQMLGWCHKQSGELSKAEECYSRSLQVTPENPEPRIELAKIQHETGKISDAIDNYRQVIATRPDLADIHNRLGVLLQATNDIEGAIDCYQSAVRYKPDFPEALCNLGDIMQKQGKTDHAPPWYEKALAVAPDMYRAWYGSARALQNLGYADDALRSYEKCMALSPSYEIRIRIATLCPIILDSCEQIDTVRDRLTSELNFIADEDFTITDPMREVDQTAFYMVYQGRNDREFRTQLARLYRQHVPALTFTAPHCGPKDIPKKEGRIRLGIISKFLKNHTIGTVMRGLITNLSREKLYVVVCGFSAPDDEISRDLERHADRYVVLPDDLGGAQRALADEELDILFYTDIGMEPLTYLLAFSRLAPVQLTSWGHAVTTGIDTIDYYISCRDFEPEDAESHYSEKLVCLSRPPTLYSKPDSPLTRTRSHFGLPESGHLYLCPQTLFKFHPEFDMLLEGILRQDPDGYLVLLECGFNAWKERLQARFSRTLSSVKNRVRILPYPGSEGYESLIALADVMLDTLHYGGGNTSLQALAAGTPIVTLPGPFQRGRHTLAYYRKMGVMDCVANSPQEYIDIAVRLGTDAGFREMVRASILKNNAVLFDDHEVVREFEAFFEQVHGSA